ncbi:hypothetical protein [Pseudomonas sp. A-B-19]|nr:hypothetical protein [Pseudomonas sp. A-B-19]
MTISVSGQAGKELEPGARQLAENDFIGKYIPYQLILEFYYDFIP